MGTLALDDKGVKGLLKEGKDITEQLNKLFVSVFTVKEIGQVPTSELCISERVSEKMN